MMTILVAAGIGAAIGAAIFPLVGDIWMIVVGAGIGTALGAMTYKSPEGKA